MKLQHNLLALFFTLAFTLMLLSTGNAKEVLQTQYGHNGMEVDLLSVKKGGKYLTMIFNFRSAGDKDADASIPVSEIHFIDDQESKKYHVLKDSKEEWIGGPIDQQGTASAAIVLTLNPGESRTVWFKFPLPPEKVRTIQVHLEQITPFDDVEITK